MKTMAMLAAATCLSVPVLPQGEPGAALEAFLAAYRVADPGAAAMLFTPGGTLFGATEAEAFRGADAIRAHFDRAWPRGGHRRIACDGVTTQQPSPGFAVISGTCQTESVAPNGRTTSGTLRLTMTLAHQEGWRILAMHLSVPPVRR